MLALGSARTGPRFVHDACGADGAEIMVIPAALPPEVRDPLVEQVVSWFDAHPDGIVVSLGDSPSIVHALAAVRRPALGGACLHPILAAMDKAWSRAVVTGTLGQLRNSVLRAGDERVPTFAENDLPVMVKPIGGCASMGIVATHAGAVAPTMTLQADWLTDLRRANLGKNPLGEDLVAVVEEYVSPEIPRVSVDGWVDQDGQAIPFAVSDNIYVDGEPERFDHQMLPTRLSPSAEAACWALYREVVASLATRYGLRSQFCDVEMFVYDREEPPRAEVMEINCRVHPNISPIFRGCLEGGDVFNAHRVAPTQRPRRRTDGRAAGGLFYIWGRPTSEGVAAVEAEMDAIACVFDRAGPKSGVHVCWGWLYIFGPTPEAVCARGAAALERMRAG